MDNLDVFGSSAWNTSLAGMVMEMTLDTALDRAFLSLATVSEMRDNDVISDIRRVYRAIAERAHPVSPQPWGYHDVAGQPLVWIALGCPWFTHAGGCGPCDGYGEYTGYRGRRRETVLEHAIRESLLFCEGYATQQLREGAERCTVNIGSATTLSEYSFPQTHLTMLLEGVNRILLPFIENGRTATYVFETRLPDLRQKRFEYLRNHLDPRIRIEIGIGFEAVNPFVQNVLVNKGYGDNALKKMKKVIDEAAKYNIGIEGHTLLGIPGLTELEAIASAIETTAALLGAGVCRGILMTTNIKQGVSLGTQLYHRGLFSSPSLHATVETMRLLIERGCTNFLAFGFAASDPTEVYARGCDSCTEKIRKAIDIHGRTCLTDPEEATRYFQANYATDFNCSTCKPVWAQRIMKEAEELCLRERLPTYITTTTTSLAI